MKQTIEVEGLPEGSEIELIEIMPSGFGDKSGNNLMAMVKLKKIQPRRIVLEETDELMNPEYKSVIIRLDGDLAEISVRSKKYWREVKESELSLFSADEGRI
jgi:hypothetical protein